MKKKKIHNFLSLCFLRKDDNLRGVGGRAKDDIRITCGGEAKKSTFNDDIISGQPLIGSIELEGVDTKNRAHRTWGVYAFIWGGERCLNLNSK